MNLPPPGSRVTVWLRGKPENGFVFEVDTPTIFVYLDSQYATLDFKTPYMFTLSVQGSAWEIGWGKKARRALERANRSTQEPLGFRDWLWSIFFGGRKITYVPNTAPFKTRVLYRRRDVLVLEDETRLGLEGRGIQWVWGWDNEDAKALHAARLLAESVQ